MKKLFFFILPFLLLNTIIYSQVSVKGYYRKDGTYVQPYMRSSPDGNPYNNYSYPGNVNPYTGKVAGGNPDTYLKKYNKNYQGDNYSGGYGYYNNNDFFLDIGYQATTAAPAGGFVLFGSGTDEKDWFLGSEIGAGGNSKEFNGNAFDSYWTGLIGINKIYFGAGEAMFSNGDSDESEVLWSAGYYNWKNHISYKIGTMYSEHTGVNLSVGIGIKFY